MPLNLKAVHSDRCIFVSPMDHAHHEVCCLAVARLCIYPTHLWFPRVVQAKPGRKQLSPISTKRL